MKEFLIPYIGPICSECQHPCFNICLGCEIFVHPNCKKCCKSNVILNQKKKNKEKKFSKRVKINNENELLDKENNKKMKNEDHTKKQDDNFELEDVNMNEENVNECNGEKCTICAVEYTEEDLEMIFCEGCEVWIHRECAGLTEKEYIESEKLEEDFFCLKCLFNYCDFCGLKEKEKDSNLYFTNTMPAFTAHKKCSFHEPDEQPFDNLYDEKDQPKIKNTLQTFPYKKLINIFKENEMKNILKMKSNKFGNSIFQIEKEKEKESQKNKKNKKIFKDGEIVKNFVKREYSLFKAIFDYSREFKNTKKTDLNFLKNDSLLSKTWISFRKEMKINEAEKELMLNKIHTALFKTNNYSYQVKAEFSKPKNYQIYKRTPEFLFLPNNNIISLKKESIDLIDSQCYLNMHKIPPNMVPKQYLQSLQIQNFSDFQKVSQKVEVKFSPIEGFGAFARFTILKDELIDFYEGIKIDFGESNILENFYIKNDFKDQIYMFSFNSGLNIKDATFLGSFAKFYNNSCEPNCYAKEVVIGNKVELGIFAKRMILKGEELTYKYDMSGDEKIKCLCRSEICVGVL